MEAGIAEADDCNYRDLSPLAFAEKGGRLHHLVRIDADGKPLSGGAILSALAEGRLRSRKGYE